VNFFSLVWEITGYFTGEGKDPTASLGKQERPLTDSLRIVVGKDAAAAWGSRELSTGPLSYLRNFSYGQTTGQADKPVLSETLYPIAPRLDISKAPRVGEETVLSCKIYSLDNVNDFSTQIIFRKTIDGGRFEGISGDKLLVNGSLEWQGDLNKDQPRQFSSTIKFPEAGQWLIHVQGESPAVKKAGIANEIRLTVGKNKSFFGWEKR
jgi:hypothetical protein